ncbi:hypothetical protein N1851_030830 [Merluccius polli]|uniref:Uncharacterized protein n=1 Tax=Merluccius polli TaxID=89951 RepID=A0AA47NQG2_MERPO|nr:hypothetical protein N1851_030830 [Merluccius polli]
MATLLGHACIRNFDQMSVTTECSYRTESDWESVMDFNMTQPNSPTSPSKYYKAVVGRPSHTLTLSLGRQVMCQVMCLFDIGSYELFSHTGAAMQMASCPGATVST